MKRIARRVALLGAVTVIAAAPSACDHRTTPPTALPSTTTSLSAQPSTTPSVSATTETSDQVDQNVIAAYVGMQNAFLKAGQLGDPAYPKLASYAAGAALTRLTDGLQSDKDSGLLTRGQAVYHPQVVSLSPPAAPTTASIRDCMDTSKTVRYKANGTPYHDSPGGLRLVLAEVDRVNGVWKVTSFGIHEVGSCTA